MYFNTKMSIDILREEMRKIGLYLDPRWETNKRHMLSMIYTSSDYLWYKIKVSIFVPQNRPKGEKTNTRQFPDEWVKYPNINAKWKKMSELQ